MRRVLALIILMATALLATDRTFAGGIGDPGSAFGEGAWTLGPEISGVIREISDGDNVRYDTESWRLLLKGSYGITDWLEVFGRFGGATIKIRGTPFDSSLGFAGGGGLKGTFLDPPGHPLRYSAGAQFLFIQADNQGATAQWLEYDIWLGTAYKDWKRLVPYGGIVYSSVDGNMRNFPSKPALDEFSSPTAFGIFLGVGWEAYSRVRLGIDARLFGENSGTFSLTYRF